MRQSFVTIVPHLRGWAEIVGLMCEAVTFWIHPQCRRSARLVLLHKYTPVEITIIKSGAMIVRRSPQCRAFSRTVIYEKSLSPLFPVGGAVVINDWCLTDKSIMEPNLCSDVWSMLHTFLNSLSFQTYVLMQCIRLSLHDTINKLEIVLLQVALPSYGCSCT